jgi:hypothetical protein
LHREDQGLSHGRGCNARTIRDATLLISRTGSGGTASARDLVMRFLPSFLRWSLLASAFIFGAHVARADGPGEVDPKADALLRKMSSDLASLQAFQVDTRNSTEVVTKDGQRLQLLAGSTVTVARPNKLRTERNGVIGDVAFFYDGQHVTVYGKRDNLYATAKAPSTLDAAIDFARDELGIDAPGADLLYADPYKILMEDAISGTYIGEEPVGDRKCHHLAYRGNETDWQVWIEDGPRALPCRFVITSKKVAGQPEYAVELDNWKVNPQVDANSFTFTPPRDAGKIDFLAVKAKKQQLEQHPQQIPRR